ncbi:hypothetical protein NL108_017209 [Boleophthalmus pectinirostris]|nr:hypothetical protein NL108_017209 [Boleophthalmus pectinirostris]
MSSDKNSSFLVSLMWFSFCRTKRHDSVEYECFLQLFSGRSERCRCRFLHQFHWEPKCSPMNDPRSNIYMNHDASSTEVWIYHQIKQGQIKTDVTEKKITIMDHIINTSEFVFI